jgi:hypothetical protein
MIYLNSEFRILFLTIPSLVDFLSWTDSYIGEMVSTTAYGQQIWDEMGEDLSHWNKDVMAMVNEAAFSFWLVDIFHFCEYR